MSPWEVTTGDVLAWAADYEGPPFHALLCDPPYHLTSIVKRFGSPGAAPVKVDTFGRGASPYSRVSHGFMGQTWDGGDVAFQPEVWAALGKHLLPGAFGMAFASSRGWHRLACAIEDAGFIIHPTIFGWLYAQGFPKATRIDNQIDRAAGEEQPVVGKHTTGRAATPKHDMRGGRYMDQAETIDLSAIHAPVTDLAKAWAGHRYGMQALKPALEPIIVFQRPYDGKPFESITRTGAGAINVDAGRVGINPNDPNHRPGITETTTPSASMFGNASQRRGSLGSGRWPPNFVLVHLPECRCLGTARVPGRPDGSVKKGRSGSDAEGNQGTAYGAETRPGGTVMRTYGDAEGMETVEVWECADGCPVATLDEQAGERRSSGLYDPEDHHDGERVSGVTDFRGKGTPAEMYADSGPASRFFPRFGWGPEDADPVRYQAKADTAEREEGLLGRIPCFNCGGLHTLTHKDDHGRDVPCRRNGHPTIKPVALCQWLASLLLPPAAYAPRRILVPFAGTGSEMLGALLAGWDYALGIELLEAYAQIARVRLDRDYQSPLGL